MIFLKKNDSHTIFVAFFSNGGQHGNLIYTNHNFQYIGVLRFSYCFSILIRTATGYKNTTENDLYFWYLILHARVEIPLKNRSRYERFERFSSKIWAVWAIWAVFLDNCAQNLASKWAIWAVLERFISKNRSKTAQDLNGFERFI